MTGHTSWPNVRADLVAKRDALTGIIATIDLHFVDGATPGEMPAVGRADRRKSGPRSGTNKQTNKQTNKAGTAPARSAEPP